MQISSFDNAAPQSILIPLSRKWQWRAMGKLFNAAIRDLSYESVLKFENKIKKEKRWEKWSQAIQKEFKISSVSPRIFVKMMIERGFRMQNLLNFADKLDDSTVSKCFYKDVQLKYMEQEVPRVQADKDVSNGFLSDISDKALKQIADLMEKNEDWRKIGDGLGFNLSQCIEFSSPLEMLMQWSLEFPNGTLKRISYEAKRLKLEDVCDYLDAIPLNKLSTIEIVDPHTKYPELRVTTVFDMEKLEGIYGASGVQIDWKKVSCKLFNQDSSKEDIWLSGNVSLKHLSMALKHCHEDSADCFEQFMEDVCSGYFEPKNSEDVSYNQVAYLAEGINQRGFNMHPDFEKWVEKHLSTCSLRAKKLSGRTFLCLYWQLNTGLNLQKLVQKMMNEVLPYDYQVILKKSYDLINPKRYYSTRLNEENQSKGESFLRV